MSDYWPLWCGWARVKQETDFPYGINQVFSLLQHIHSPKPDWWLMTLSAKVMALIFQQQCNTTHSVTLGLCKPNGHVMWLHLYPLRVMDFKIFESILPESLGGSGSGARLNPKLHPMSRFLPCMVSSSISVWMSVRFPGEKCYIDAVHLPLWSGWKMRRVYTM